MAGGINANRWTSYMADIFRVLRPGGWCQMVEIYYNAQSDNGSLTDGRSALGQCLAGDVVTDRAAVVLIDHALRRWSMNYLQIMQLYKDPRAALQLQNLMRQAGFVQVEVRPLTLPLSGWSNGSLSHPSSDPETRLNSQQIPETETSERRIVKMSSGCWRRWPSIPSPKA